MDWPELLPQVALQDLGPRAQSPSVPARELVDRALAGAGAEAFLDSARAAGAPITVVVNDPHRATQTSLVLEALVALGGRGGQGPAMRVLVATGSHRFDASERARHEEWLLGRVARDIDRVIWHDARDDSQLEMLEGWCLSRHVAHSSFVVAVGSLEPHYFAGVTGAHKTLTIGVMGLDELRRNHAGALEPGSRSLALEGNPVFDGVVPLVASLASGGRRLLAVNQLLVNGAVIAVFAGEPLAALRAGLPAVRDAFCHVSEPVDVVISAVEPPLDRDLYQADKGIKNVESVVRDGGVLLLVARCSEGIGIDHFVELLRTTTSHAEALERVRCRGYRLGDHKAVRLRALTDRAVRGVRVGVLAQGLDEVAAASVGVQHLASPAAAARWIETELGPGAHRGLVVRDSGNLCLERQP